MSNTVSTRPASRPRATSSSRNRPAAQAPRGTSSSPSAARSLQGSTRSSTSRSAPDRVEVRRAGSGPSAGARTLAQGMMSGYSGIRETGAPNEPGQGAAGPAGRADRPDQAAGDSGQARRPSQTTGEPAAADRSGQAGQPAADRPDQRNETPSQPPAEQPAGPLEEMRARVDRLTPDQLTARQKELQARIGELFSQLPEDQKKSWGAAVGKLLNQLAEQQGVPPRDLFAARGDLIKAHGTADWAQEQLDRVNREQRLTTREQTGAHAAKHPEYQRYLDMVSSGTEYMMVWQRLNQGR